MVFDSLLPFLQFLADLVEIKIFPIETTFVFDEFARIYEVSINKSLFSVYV
jgi:hypothetical protein